MFLLLGLSLMFLMGAGHGLSNLFNLTPEAKDIGIVRKADLVQQVTVAGLLSPNRRSVLSPPYAGYVKKLFVQIGDRVKKGDPVVTIVQSLTGASEEAYPMRAPFDGIVSQVLRTEGEFVEPAKENNGLVRIDDMTRLFVQSDVPETDIAKIKTGQKVLIKANALADQDFRGVIRNISLAAVEKKEWSRSADRVEFTVKMEVFDPTAQLHPGMSVIVDIITNKRDKVLALPHEFIDKEADDYFVILESGEKRPVKVGMQNEDSFEIKSGLKENDRVRMVDFFQKAN